MNDALVENACIYARAETKQSRLHMKLIKLNLQENNKLQVIHTVWLLWLRTILDYINIMVVFHKEAFPFIDNFRIIFQWRHLLKNISSEHVLVSDSLR